MICWRHESYFVYKMCALILLVVEAPTLAVIHHLHCVCQRFHFRLSKSLGEDAIQSKDSPRPTIMCPRLAKSLSPINIEWTTESRQVRVCKSCRNDQFINDIWLALDEYLFFIVSRMKYCELNEINGNIYSINEPARLHRRIFSSPSLLLLSARSNIVLARPQAHNIGIRLQKYCFRLKTN